MGTVTILGWHISVVRPEKVRATVKEPRFKPKSPVRSGKCRHIPITTPIVVPWVKPQPWQQ